MKIELLKNELRKAKNATIQLARTVNTISENAGLGKKVSEADFTQFIDSAIKIVDKE